MTFSERIATEKAEIEERVKQLRIESLTVMPDSMKQHFFDIIEHYRIALRSMDKAVEAMQDEGVDPIMYSAPPPPAP